MDPKANDRRVTNQTDDPNEARIEALLELFPEIVGEVDGATGRRLIDYDRLQEILSGRVDDADERYNFTWAGKASARRSLRLPAVGTLRPAPEESVNWDTTRNIFIEGENFETLKLLLRPYYGQVKMIYIDPPYNTGGDFVYPDNYADPLEHYYRVTGQKDTEGNLLTTNKDTNGRFHSNWLNMMYPRLFLARQLLRDDGVIFVTVDDNEACHLRLLMNEIFGEQNFVATVVWQKKQSPQNDAINLSDMHDYVVVYAKRKTMSHGDSRGWERQLLPRNAAQVDRYENPDNDPRGPWTSVDYTCNKTAQERPNLYYALRNPNTGEQVWPSKQRVWRYDRAAHQRNLDQDRIWWGPDGTNVPRVKRFIDEVAPGVVPSTWWPRDEVGDNQEARRRLRHLFPADQDAFDTPKPPRLVRRMLDVAVPVGEHAVVMDFFAGSCSTAEAVLHQNRKATDPLQFVMVQLPEPMENTDFRTIADVGKERIRRVIAEMNEEGEPGDHEDRGFRVFKLGDSTMRSWQAVETADGSEPTQEDYAKQMELFEDPLKDGWTPEDVIAELALKEAHIGLDYRVEAVDGVDGQTVYRVSEPDTDRRFYVCLDDAVAVEPLRALDMDQETLFICRAVALDDETTANLAMQCRLRVI